MNEAHEARCNRCGECCRINYRTALGTVTLALHCPAWDERAGCLIYAQRHTLLPVLCPGHTCLPIANALAVGTPPASCAYAPKGYRRKSTPVALCSTIKPEEMRSLRQRNEIERRRVRSAVGAVA